MAHDVQWYSPAPFWREHLDNGTRDRLQQPALLGFGQDNFMGVLQEALEEEPNALPDKSPGGEEYPDRDENESSASDGETIPLYQPAHERYYLVTASLVCRERGLPDRAVDTTNEEKAAFVLRRLEPIDSQESQTLLTKTDAVQPVEVNEKEYIEYGWTGTAWKPVKDPTEAVKEEKRLSMFPQSYAPETPMERMKGDRRVWAGLLPVAKRETFETAPVRSNALLGAEDVGDEEGGESGTDSSNGGSSGSLQTGDKLSDPRKTKFETRIIGAFRQLSKNLQKPKELSVTTEDVRDSLLFAWLDLLQFLEEHLSEVADQIKKDKPVGNDSPKVLRVLDAINVSEMKLGKKATDALRTIDEHRSAIETGSLDGALKPKELDRDTLFSAVDALLKEKVLSEGNSERPELQRAINSALGVIESPEQLPDELKPPTTDPTISGLYVVHCLYERPKCPEPLKTQVSKPSRPFRLASFFDSKAPPRDINITLPSASLKDLRDSSQSVSMVFTKELRNQAERVQNLTLEKLQQGESGSSPGVDVGMICSLSIPIITICALVLLLIMVVLLNIVFWWLPFFKICFPIPKSS